MSSSGKRQKKKIVLKMPSHVEIMKSVRVGPVLPSRKERPKKGKGAKYKRTDQKRRLRKDMDN